MANEQTIPVTPATLPSGFCPADLQSMLNGFSAYQSVTIPVSQGNLIVQATTPTDTTATWLQLDSLGRPVRVYYFASGAWLSKHPLEPGITVIWTTALPNLNTFDGGDANVISAISGPMWEVVLSAKFPLGAGTLPSGAVVAVGATGGEETHTLVAAEIPAHTHFIASTDSLANDDAVTATDQVARQKQLGGDSGNYKLIKSAVDASLGKSSSFGGDGTGVTTGHQNMPQYQAVHFLRRSARQFYRV